MGLIFEIAPETRTLSFKTNGDVDYNSGLQILVRGLSTAAASSADTKWHLLFDLTESRENRSGDQLRSIADIIASRKDILSGACVLIAADDLHYGLSRMFGAYLEQGDFTINVTSTRVKALAWLSEQL